MRTAIRITCSLARGDCYTALHAPEAVDRVPDEMTDPAAQMQEKSKGAAEQNDLAGPRPDRAVNDAVGLEGRLMVLADDPDEPAAPRFQNPSLKGAAHACMADAYEIRQFD
jgi:hypothetical protein